MKKILSLFTLIAAALTLIGCETVVDLPDPDTYALTLTSDYEEASLTQDPEGPHETGDEVTITASWDDEEVTFVHWEESGDVLSEEPSFTYTVENDATLEAVFEDAPSDTFTLTVDANVQGPTFSMDPEGPYESGDVVTLTPDYDEDDHVFLKWRENGQFLSEEEVLEYTVTDDATLEAVFDSAGIEPAMYTETFEDFYSTGSQYRDFTQIGVNGIEWHFTDTRTDQRFDSVSDAVTLGDTPSRDASMTAIIPEGISYFNVYYENAFQTPAGFELYINGELVGTAPEVENTIGFFELDDLDVRGEFELKILPTNGQLTLDDLTWENNVPGSDYPVVSFDSPYWDAEFEADPDTRLAPGSDVTVTASDPEGLYSFLRWEDGEGQTLSEENPYTFTLEEDTFLYAVFDNPPAYTLRLESNYYLAELETDIDRPVVEGTEVLVSANDPENQYGFIGWEDEDGTLVSEDETFSYTTTDTDMTLTAVYDVPEPIDFMDMTLTELTSLDLDRYDGYYADLEGLHGEALRDEIQSLMQSQVSYRSYDEARQILQESDRDPDNHDHVIQLYTRQSVPGEWDGGSTWNREHVWPSRRFPGERTSDIGSDLHHLAPADPGENSARGYKFFDWDTTSTAYEPHDDVKGDVSRMMFYMDVLYDELTLVDENPDADNHEMGSLEVMLEWHVFDEVSHFEMYRNDVIEDYQYNRNPFIDYPHLAYLVYYDHPEVGLD